MEQTWCGLNNRTGTGLHQQLDNVHFQCSNYSWLRLYHPFIYQRGMRAKRPVIFLVLLLLLLIFVLNIYLGDSPGKRRTEALFLLTFSLEDLFLFRNPWNSQLLEGMLLRLFLRSIPPKTSLGSNSKCRSFLSFAVNSSYLTVISVKLNSHRK